MRASFPNCSLDCVVYKIVAGNLITVRTSVRIHGASHVNRILKVMLIKMLSFNHISLPVLCSPIHSDVFCLVLLHIVNWIDVINIILMK